VQDDDAPGAGHASSYAAALTIGYARAVRGAILIGLAGVACGKGEAPPPAPPLAASAIVPISTRIHGESTKPVELGRVTVPRVGAGTVTAILSGHVAQICREEVCNDRFQFALGVCRDPEPGPGIDKACADGRTFESDLYWPPARGASPDVLTVPVAVTASFAVDGKSDTVIHLLSWAFTTSRLEGELTLVYTPGAPLAVKADGLVQPHGPTIAE
jgi:hypothetical protein